MFVNKDKKSYELEYVINSIKNDKDYRGGYKNCISRFNDDEWCDQFLSQLHKEFEIVIVRNISGMKDGFYIVDRNYTKFVDSSFITKKKMKCISKEIGKKPLLTMMYKGISYNKTYSKSIDKYFVKYIKQNTIKYYTYDEFVKEFNPQSTKPSNNRFYQPHTKSLHTVRGFWKKQPYGSRSNPKYKMIWIESFQRGGKKVG